MADDDLDPRTEEALDEATQAEDLHETPDGETEEPSTALEAVEAALRRGADDDGDGPEDAAEAGVGDPDGSKRTKAAGDGDPKRADGQAQEAGPDLTPPEGISAKARERFERMAEGYRELGARYQETNERLTGLQEVLAETGASPEELSTLMHFSKLTHSNRPEHLEQAWEIIDRERRALAVKLGKVDAVPDLLKSYPELEEAVRNMDLTEQHALEIARHREAGKLQQAETQRTAHETAFTQRVTVTRDALNALEARLSASDADYAKKAPFLREAIPSLAQAYGHDPRALVAAVEAEYQRIGKMMLAAAPQRPRPTRARQALSSGSASGAPPTAAPKNTLDAITRAIGHGIDG